MQYKPASNNAWKASHVNKNTKLQDQDRDQQLKRPGIKQILQDQDQDQDHKTGQQGQN